MFVSIDNVYSFQPSHLASKPEPNSGVSEHGRIKIPSCWARSGTSPQGEVHHVPTSAVAAATP
jgi:hypothetical protein